MSCSSWTNSISVSGTAVVELVAQVGDDLLGGSVALAARLQPHEDVAAVLLRGEHAQLGAGAADVGRDLRRLARIASTFFSRTSVSSSAMPAGVR